MRSQLFIYFSSKNYNISSSWQWKSPVNTSALTLFPLFTKCGINDTVGMSRVNLQIKMMKALLMDQHKTYSIWITCLPSRYDRCQN